MAIFTLQLLNMSKLVASLESGPHFQLNQLAGNWAGETRTWFEPGDPVDVSPMTGQIRPLFDGRFMLHEYKGSFQGKPFEGIAIYGHHIKNGNFQAAWMDTFHMGTGIMLSEGVKDGEFFSVQGSYTASAEDTQAWGWRTTIELKDDGSLVITAYNIEPGGQEQIATETRYQRQS